MSSTTNDSLKNHLCRLAQLGANITDAHSCFIFLPPRYLNRPAEAEQNLLVAGYHSLCSEVLPDCIVKKGSGLIGWVAEHAQPIHVSPFEHDSRTLGMYREDRQLKSFIGIPIKLNQSSGNNATQIGVLTCDSKKSFAFSKLQGKLLGDLAGEIAVLTELILEQSNSQPIKSWKNFIDQGVQIVKTLGSTSVDILRLRVLNFSALERELGSADCVELTQQLFRLIQQSLPPNFAHFQLPNGDFLIVLDNMLTSFYENKIIALARHIAPEDCSLKIEFSKQPLRSRSYQFTDLADAISHTAFEIAGDQNASDSEESKYEYRRA